MVIASTKLVGRVRKPTTSNKPPKNSALPASSAMVNPGERPIESIHCPVPSKPYPPNQAKSFCAPWAVKIML